MRKSWIVVCLFNFLIAGLMGLLMRLTNVIPQNFDYAKLIHAHSHTAMLGWVYMMIYCFFLHHFVPPEKKKNYNTLFWLTQISVTGMMISFPLQGYAMISITFSSLHILCSYIFGYRIWRDNNVTFLPVKRLLSTSLLFMLMSTLGAWSLGIIVNFVGKESNLYKTAIQFFLHFQFNGWFVFAVLSIFFSIIYKQGIFLSDKLFRPFYYYLTLSAILTFALPISWHFSHQGFVYINAVGLTLQIASAIYFIIMMRRRWQEIIKNNTSVAKWLLIISMISLLTKTIMQSMTVFPEFAEASQTVRNFTIGFIHLGMLGLINGFLFFFLAQGQFIGSKNTYWKTGMLVFYIGFLLTELILFFQGLLNFLKIPMVREYPEILFVASLLLPAGLVFILISLFSRKSV